MITKAPSRARQSYRHEALLWHDRADFLAGLVPFVVEGLDAGEPVLAILGPDHARWICDELGARASQVRFVDMVELARNPLRVLPALQGFLDQSCGPGRPARAFGEPVWPGQRPEQLEEMQLNEALLNLAVDPDLPFWLVCAYPVDNVDEPPADVACSHPVIATSTSYTGSASYRGRDQARALFTADLPVLEAPDEDVWTDERSLDLVAEQVTLRAAESDLLSDRVVALTDVIRGLVVGSVDRGAAGARVRLWDEPDALVCEVADPMVVDDFLMGRRLPALQGRPDPVWHANQVCDLVQVRSGPRGTTVRLHVRK